MRYATERTPPATQASSPPIFPWWFLYVAFVIYGSLVPLDFSPIPLDHAVARFLDVPMRSIGAAGRADWIANGVLYVPVGFLTALGLLAHRRGAMAFLLSGGGTLVFSTSLAVAIEFAQLFFPPRTVSLNDLLAECIGALLGMCLAFVGGGAFLRILSGITNNMRLSKGLLLGTYACGYIAFSLFPYDLLVSWQEVEQKRTSGQWGWLVARGATDESMLAFVGKFPAEVLMAIPLGFLLGWASYAARPIAMARAVGLAIVFGVSLEILQFFIVSGISQGLSVVTRVAGVCAGVGLWNSRRTLDAPVFQRLVRKLSFPLGLPYLAALVALSGWFTSPWQEAHIAFARIAGEVRFVPFYYHYYTTEARALFSLSSVALIYAPIGLAAWGFRRSARDAGLSAMLLALVVEIGKLFPLAARPDPTNILIAGIGAFVAVRVLHLVADAGSSIARDHRSMNAVGVAPVCCAFVVLASLLWLRTFPTQPFLLGILFVLYAVTLWRWPVLLIAAIPAAVPLLDLAPWSGRFFLDELDWLILISLVIGYARMPQSQLVVPYRSLLFACAALVTLSFAVSTVRALLPWQLPDANAFNNYLSPFNALRITKGALWAVLLMPLMLRAHAAGRDVIATFGAGMVVGLAGTVLFALWERASFTELLDYDHEYRIAGPISAIHIGGAYIECLLTITTPFVLVKILRARFLWQTLAGVLLMLGATYALMVTFSRSGYFAYAAMLLVILVAALRQPGPRYSKALIGGGVVATCIVLAWPILIGSFAQSRIATVERDLMVRETHWIDSLSLRNDDWPTVLLGMGVGRFPSTNYWNSPPSDRPASYGLVNAPSSAALRFGNGKAIFMDQIVPVQPEQTYRLQLDLRSSDAAGTAKVQICHKWQLSSYDCSAQVFQLQSGDKWQRFERVVESGALGADAWYAARPVKLTLLNAGLSSVEFDNVRLFTSDGRDLLANGNFDQGLDHWSFTSDHHLAWHIKQLVGAVLFDQGVLGIVAFGALVIAAVWRCARATWRGNLQAGGLLAALVGFLILGMFDTLIDSPRFLMLFLWLHWLAFTSNLRPRLPT